MTTFTEKKQAAGNNAILARLKAKFNKLVYKEIVQTWNEQGRAATMTYVGTMFNDTYRAERVAELFNLS